MTRDISRFRQLKKWLQHKADTLRTLDKEILGKTPDKELEDETQQSDIFAESVQLHVVVMKLAKALEEIEGTSDSTTKTASRRSTPPSSPTHVYHQAPVLGMAASLATATVFSTTRVKLPKLSLRKFDGDMSKRMSFSDSLESTVHQNPDLSEVDKFNYLTLMLEHSASGAIGGLSLTASNYNEAVAILRKRFGNKQVIISRH